MGRIRFGDARSALRKLIEDPGQTEMVFEITEALAGNQPQRLLRRVRRSPGGARLLRERPVFDPETCDLGELLELPVGTFGHELARWMKDNDFRPGLMERESGATDPELAYVGKRLTQMHDLWHVLTGYNRDPVGELGVLAFSFGQTATRGIGFILSAILWRSIVENWRTSRRPWSALVAYLWRPYRVGRRARFLPPLILEDLFPLPLESARALLGIEPLTASFAPEALPPIAAPAPA
jgi:ubiquinone biosynthesis protein COQ4